MCLLICPTPPQAEQIVADVKLGRSSHCHVLCPNRPQFMHFKSISFRVPFKTANSCMCRALVNKFDICKQNIQTKQTGKKS